MLQLLTVSELRGVLAHEFGHFHSGDTRLSPWLYKTHVGIRRTLANLSAARHAIDSRVLALVLAILRMPFVGFGALFMRVTVPPHGRRLFLSPDHTRIDLIVRVHPFSGDRDFVVTYPL